MICQTLEFWFITVYNTLELLDKIRTGITEELDIKTYRNVVTFTLIALGLDHKRKFQESFLNEICIPVVWLGYQEI